MAYFPPPINGLVIRYAYLWLSEKQRGLEHGLKDRPCAVVLTIRKEPGKDIVVALPITHSPPHDPELALEIPADTKARLGLDSERSWIVLSEYNSFSWPGPDLRPALNGDPSTISYGLLPRQFYRLLRDRFIAVLKAKRAGAVDRDE